MDQRRMHARVMMSWWDIGDRVVITRDEVKSGALTVRVPSYEGNDPLWLIGCDRESIEVTTKDLITGAIRIKLERPVNPRRKLRLKWFSGTDCTTGRTVRGLHLPTCSKEKGVTALRDPYAQETYDVHASTLRPVTAVRRPRSVQYRPATAARPGTSLTWEREFGGTLYRFHLIITRNGELRSHVQVFNGDRRGLDTWYAWDCVRISQRR